MEVLPAPRAAAAHPTTGGLGKMGRARRSATTSSDGESTPGGRRPIYAVYGPDDFLRRQAVDEIVHEVLGEDVPPMARLDVDGTSVALADVLDELRTLPFLASVRLVVVHDADPLIAKHREALERYAEAPSPSGVLVLVCKVMNKNWRLAKAIQKVGLLRECKAPPPWERDKWLIGRARQGYDKRLQPASARALVELAGDDMASLDAELAKLAIYVDSRDTITEKDVEDLVGVTRPEKVFRMVDALGAGDPATALATWRQTLATDNQASFRAIGGIAWAVRQMIAVKQGAQPRASASTSRAAARFSMEQLQDMLVQLLAADVACKTGLASVGTAVEKFILRQCASG